MKGTRWKLLVFFLFFCFSSKTTAQQPQLWNGLEKGAFDVGFNVVRLYDHARPFRAKHDERGNVIGNRARPIQLFVWYPAIHKPTDTTLTYAEYVYGSDVAAKQWIHNDEHRRSITRQILSDSPDSVLLEKVLGELFGRRTAAVKDAEMANGSFPLLIFGSGGRTPGYIYSTMCEFLASHGYVAVTLPSLPRREGESWPFSHVGLGLQIQDMEFAINHMVSWPMVNRDKLGLVAWSVGGVSQALLQMQNTDVDVLVSLDSGSGYRYGITMIRESIYFDSTAVTIPYMHAHGKAPARYEVRKDFTFYNSLASREAYLLTFENLNHSEFRSHTVLEHKFMKTERADGIIAAHDVLTRAVLFFLNAHLKGMEGAQEQLLELGPHGNRMIMSMESRTIQ